MATRTVKARVEVDGEQKYKQTMQELAKSNQVVNSELKKLQERYKGAEQSTEYLTKKGELLEEELTNQSAKVILLRQKLQEAKDQYGENSEEAKGWQIQLNNAEKEQYKLVNAIDENNEAMQQQGKTMVSLGDAVDSVAEKLGIRLPKSAKDALNGMKGFSAGTVVAMTAVAAAVAGVVKVVKELNDLTLQQAANADNLQSESLVTGLGTDTLQTLQYAENLIDVSADTITGSLTKLTNAIYDASNGNEKLAETFDFLGVATTNVDGSLRSAEEVFYDVIDSLGEVQNQTERDAIAMDLMGKSAQDLNPLILQGSEALRDLADEAKATGYVLDQSQIKKLAEVDDAYQRTQLQIEATKNMLAVEFAPASKSAMETFGNVVQKAGQMLVDTHIIENLGAVVQGVAGIVDAVTSFTGKIPGWLNPIQNLSNELRMLATVAATVADTVNLISGIMPWNWGSGKAKTALGLNLGSGQMSYQQQLKYSTGDYTWYNAGGTDNWRGGLTWVGEAGPELVALPQGSRIYNAQDSRAIAATGTDTARLEALMERNVMLLEQINSEFSGLKVKGRMV